MQRFFIPRLISRLFLISAILFAAAPVSAGSQLQTDLVVEDAYVYLPIPGRTSTAAFFTLRNNAAQAATLVGVKTESARAAELHSHSHEDGMMRMRREDRVIIPASGSISFAPGSWHVMLFDVASGLSTGGQVHLTLEFSDGKILPVTAQVRSRFDTPQH